MLISLNSFFYPHIGRNNINSMGSMSHIVKHLAYNLYQISCPGNSRKENPSMSFLSNASFPSFVCPNHVFPFLLCGMRVGWYLVLGSRISSCCPQLSSLHPFWVPVVYTLASYLGGRLGLRLTELPSAPTVPEQCLRLRCWLPGATNSQNLDIPDLLFPTIRHVPSVLLVQWR